MEDASLSRPVEPVPLLGDPTKAKCELGWQPTVKFAELARMMVDADLAAAQQSNVQLKNG